MVRGKSEDKALRDLFRKKLEFTEVMPSFDAGDAIMRSLAKKEFLRFNPSRFNIWYLGGIAAAGITLAIIFSTGRNENNDIDTEKPIDMNSEVVSEPVRNNAPDHLSMSGSELASKKTTEEIRKSDNELFRPVKSNTPALIHREQPDLKIDESTRKIPVTGVGPNMPARRNRLVKNAGISEQILEASVKEGCKPLKVRFSNLDLSCDSCIWTFGDGGNSRAMNPEWIFDLEGEYNVRLQIFYPDGEKLTVSTVITIHPDPVARFEISPENVTLPDDEVFFHNYSTGAERYIWFFGDDNLSELFEPKHYYNHYDKYDVSLVAVSSHGCVDSLVVKDAYAGSGYYIDFPNAFIANINGPSGGYFSSKSDEEAHVFHPVYSGISDYQLTIYNRIGMMLFESRDINIGWDGYYKGELSESGVYIWKVRGSFLNGEPFTKMGDVTLLKK